MALGIKLGEGDEKKKAVGAEGLKDCLERAQSLC